MKVNCHIFILFISVLSLVRGDFEPKITLTQEKEVSKELFYFDDSHTIIALRSGDLYISNDDGVKWQKAQGIDKTVMTLKMDPVFPYRAFALTVESKQFITNDKGKTWQSFEVEPKGKEEISIDSIPRVIFNRLESRNVIFDFYNCPNQIFSSSCKHHFYYTNDGFKTNPSKLEIDASICQFGTNDLDIFCVENEMNSFGHVKSSNLVKSRDSFRTKKVVNHHLAKSGKLIDVRTVENFIIAIVQNDKFNTKSKITLLVSTDGTHFQPADLQVDVSYGILTFLDSSPSSMFISVASFNSMAQQFSVGTVYASDSTGTRFHKVLEKVEGNSFQKVQTIDGVWLASVLDDTATDGSDDGKSLIDILLGENAGGNFKSLISFNNGRDFNPIRIEDESCKESDGCSLHIMTPSERDGEGKFVTGPTPGILMAVGNTGKFLTKEFSDMKTYISHDGGSHWKQAIDEPCLFSFGDLGNIIIAMPYYGKEDMSTKTLYYSLDQGLTWTKKDLEKGIFPLTVTTTIDGTSSKFIISGLIDETPDKSSDFEFAEVIYALDFSKAYDHKCKDKDFEEVYARVDDNNKPTCIYGHREKFRRRKASSKCFAATLFKDITVYDESCPCTDDDYECNIGFKPGKDNTCEPDKRVIAHLCRTKKSKTLKLFSKIRLTGTECSDGKTSMKVDVLDVKCSDYIDNDPHHESNHKIHHKQYVLEGKMKEYTYFEQGEDYNGENLLIRTEENRLYASRDGGVEFVKVPIYEEILAYFMGYIPGQMILITESEKFLYSIDAGNTYNKLLAPSAASPVASTVVAYHKTDSQQFIWFGSELSSSCSYGGDKFNSDCKVTGYITKDGGSSFNKLRDDVIKCDFVSSHLQNGNVSNPNNLIYCSVLDKEKKTVNLISSSNNFKDEKVIAENIVGYAISGNFVVVGKIDQKKQTLHAMVTVDGETFADASMPRDLNIDIRQAFTVLDSEKGAIFMHVTTNSDDKHEYGAILKSNSNGTSYALSLDYVNRDKLGFVDYDRIEGIEGILISNVVQNHAGGDHKKLKSMITHNDGGEWNYIKPPSKDSKGKKYKCTGKSLQECSLNLHGFTERADYRDTYSSASAIGIMMGLGNVGKSLHKKEESSLYLTRDGGNNWHEIRKGEFMWEYGDRGSILVIVKEGETNHISYSLDEGRKWMNYKFSKENMKITDLATVPSDNSRKFLVFGEKDGSTVVVSIDFTDVFDRQCQLDLDHPDQDDFEYWSPKHPLLKGNCLFGHEAKYLRRAHGHYDCFVGSAPLTDGFKISKNCSCTRKDFECDYNYYRDPSDDTCKLVKGLSPADHKNEMCKNNVFEYVEPTGYRKIPLSTCSGGKNFDSLFKKPCPGKESEFNKYYGKDIGFGKLLIIIIIPLAVFLFATWFVYDRGIRRNGGFKQFGQIRLDGDENDFDFDPIENNQVDKVVNNIVKGGIFTVAAVIATVKTLRKFDKMVFERLTAQIFRGSGRRNYVRVPDINDEEDELFGNFQDNYEEELEQGNNNDLYRDFGDDVDDDNNELDVSEDTEVRADSRLFDVDDQSDEEPSKQ
ncbi:vacuolar protein sorting/targeting protein 10 [[Candida] jaroonii]|uniref:Vacuolar protein sorting/targeting protein 10 n=1 Tax=[Candida] jaroonii TaxID=467808 RepID=A0ACA9Y6B5_9ASCO|nr:vacuolar protein sorting/targeting protein 10 [[Candida] jaroonii]